MSYAGLSDIEIAQKMRQQAREEMQKHKANALKSEGRLMELMFYYRMNEEHMAEMQMLVRDMDRSRRLAMVEQMKMMSGVKR